MSEFREIPEMKRYKVRVVESHVDYVWIEAPTAREAADLAPALSECNYECLYDCEIVDEEDIDESNKD